jgi:hypothetical protein
MSKHLPPIPPANRSPKGPGDNSKTPTDAGSETKPVERNYDQQGRQGNSKINTTHQGYQQDR